MKKMLSVISLLMALLMLMSFAGCAGTGNVNNENNNNGGAQAAAPEKTNIYTIKGPTGMGMAELIATDKASETPAYNVNVVAAPTDITAAIVNGDADIAACPVNLASVLYNKTSGGVKILAVNTLGVTYIVTNGVEINSIADLRGKTIISAGQGATPEYILNKLLTDNGMKVGEDVFVEFKSEHADVASLLLAGEADIVLLPEPNVTSSLIQNPELKTLDLTKEWEEMYNTQLVQGCVIARTEFVEKYPDAVNSFLADYKESVDVINTATDEAAQMIVDAGIIPKAPIAKKAIPTSHIEFITGDSMEILVKENLLVLYNANPTSVGGNLPDDNFYYNYQAN